MGVRFPAGAGFTWTAGPDGQQTTPARAGNGAETLARDRGSPSGWARVTDRLRRLFGSSTADLADPYSRPVPRSRPMLSVLQLSYPFRLRARLDLQRGSRNPRRPPRRLAGGPEPVRAHRTDHRTGDIAFSGKAREYETADGFLREVRSRVGNPRIPVRVIPPGTSRWNKIEHSMFSLSASTGAGDRSRAWK
jgi:hypothetical protein